METTKPNTESIFFDLGKFERGSEEYEEFRNSAIELHMPMAKSISDAMSRRFPPSVDPDDLFQAACIGLQDAVEAFDPTRGVKFRTYATLRIKGAILDEIRSQDHASRQLRSMQSKVKKAARKLEKQLFREPTDEELAKFMDVDMSMIAEFNRRKANLVNVSIFSEQTDSENRSMSRIDTIEDSKSANPYVALERQELLMSLVRGLNDIERYVITLYYHEKLTMKEIGAVLDFSESRVCQVHKAVLGRIKQTLIRIKNELLD